MYLYGASGHCKVIIDTIASTQQLTINGIVDDHPNQDELYGIPVFNTKEFETFSDKNIIVSVGDNGTRKKIVTHLAAAYPIAVHAKAVVSAHATVGGGTVIMAAAVINPDAFIGQHCIINTAAIIEHECKIGDFVHVSPNAALAGGVTVGEGTHIGMGAIVIQGIKIGKWATIGAGAVVISDVPDYAVVVGNPGKIIKYNREHE
ncbi:acetyltransferase [Flavobacterium sp. RSP15]|uniref:acetyltransferase n=1 Tax=Flavobacterium sp. RSP15 TaxID=2497485 RepID=UPI000F82A229|nr:acetyltransferase [Flavobacterium sp. RSP15]RTY86006.1 acetyltransferase [Flavobacterium sp. RSP15]